jgi:hypothetical protein
LVIGECGVTEGVPHFHQCGPRSGRATFPIQRAPYRRIGVTVQRF